MPLDDLALCVRLRLLRISCASFKEDCEPSTAIKCSQLDLETHGSIQNMVNILQRGKTGVKPIFDLRGLKELSLTMDSSGPRSEYNQLFEETPNLETLELCMKGAYQYKLTLIAMLCHLIHIFSTRSYP